MEDQEKCTMQSALNVDKNVKFLLNLILTDLCTAENVTLNEDHREEIDIKLTSCNLFTLFNLLFYILFFTRPNVECEKQL